jgi:pimeloyl-ACP methyl ester carboxylesterase
METTLFRFVAERGPHGVGLNVVAQYDHARTWRHLRDALGREFPGERARPLQTLIWYPTDANAGRSMRVSDYWGLWETETTFDEPRVPRRAKEWRAALSPTLTLPLWAVRDAAQASGRFPVIVYAPSFSAPAWENADLCEYLASHGFVVLSTPSMGANTRNMTTDLSGLNAQASDISFLIAYARTLPNTDVAKVAVAGFSWGGLANLFAAARDNRIGALVCLDGSVRYWPAMVRKAGDVRPPRMTIPLASFAKAEWTLEEQARYLSSTQLDGPNVLNAWTHGDLVAIHMFGMSHRQFSSMAQRNEDVWKDFYDCEFPDRQRGDFIREDGTSAYGWVARYTLAFLNAHLKQDAAEMAYLRRHPSKNGVPKHCMEVSYRTARGSPVSIDALRSRIECAGFGHVARMYAEMLGADPTVGDLDETELNDWAEELIDAGRLGEAVALLTLNARNHADSSSAHMNLARALELSGRIGAARGSYRKAVELSGINAEARRRLAELERGTDSNA